MDTTVWAPEKKREAFNQVLAKIEKGESLRKALKKPQYHRVPSMWTLIQWMKKSQTMHSEYLFACSQRADKFFEEIITIADNVKADKVAIAKAILQIDARKWALSKMHKAKVFHP